jgi:hypothetical protein
VFQQRPLSEIEPQILEKNTLGKEKGGGVIHRHRKERIEEG